MNPRSIVATGLLTLTLAGGCVGAPPAPSPTARTAPPPAPRIASTVTVLTLKSCEELRGELVRNGTEQLVLQQGPGLREVPRSEVSSIRREQPLASGQASGQPATTGRLLGSGHMVDVFATRPWVKGLEPVQSTVIHSGPLRGVPYRSYRAGSFEFNIYGAPERPAGMEVGIYAGRPGAREAIRDLLFIFLTRVEDRELVRRLSLDQDKREREGLTFEVTPPTASDAEGGWWLSIYDVCALERARAPEPG